MTVAVGDIYQVQIEFQRDVEVASIVRHMEVTGATDTDEDSVGDELCAAVVQEVETGWIPLMGPNANLICVTCRRLPPGEPTRTYINFSSSGTGTGTTNSHGAQQALLTSLYAASGAVVKAGRNYLPFLAGENSFAGQVVTSVLTAIENAVESILVSTYVLPGGTELTPAIARKVISDWISDLIVSFVVRPVLASQRRRVNHHQTTVIPPI